MVKVIARMGLLFMDPKERKERLDVLMDGNAIHCDKVGELIDQSRRRLRSAGCSHALTA